MSILGSCLEMLCALNIASAAPVAPAIGHMAPLPPLEYNKPVNKVVEVTFTHPVLVHLACGGDIPSDLQIFACARVNGNRMIVPDPCLHTEESYARLLCHELGHINGWPADHPGAVKAQ